MNKPNERKSIILLLYSVKEVTKKITFSITSDKKFDDQMSDFFKPNNLEEIVCSADIEEKFTIANFTECSLRYNW